MLALGVFQKGYCLSNGWSSPAQFWRACYSDVPVLHASTPGLADRALPYLDQGWDQPLLSGVSMWLLSWLVPPGVDGVGAQQWIFITWALVALVLVALMLVALVSMMPSRPWHAAHLAATPVLATAALVSVDLVGVTALVWGLWCWWSRRPVGGGALLALAFLAQPMAGVVVIAILLVASRQHRLTAAVHLAITMVLTTAALLAPFVLLTAADNWTPVHSWWGAAPGYGSPVLIPQLLGAPLTATGATVIAALGWLAAIGLGVWLTRPAARRVTLTRTAAPMLIVVALTQQALPVQVAVWLIPLIALSMIGWRDHLIWVAVEILHFIAVWLHIGFSDDPGRGLPPEAYALAVLARACAWIYLGWRIWAISERPVSRPRHPGTVTAKG